MISVEEARRIVMARIPYGEVSVVPLTNAMGGYAAVEVLAPHDHPLFDMSAVDGYAFAHDERVKEWAVVASIAAGEAYHGTVLLGSCVRIFTGAMLPRGTDTVVMQEFVQTRAGRITHVDPKLTRESNVRRRAEQINQGDPILRQGTRIGPAVIGLLASVGVKDISILSAPQVAVLVTGNEFIQDDGPTPGKIFSSNDQALYAALTEAGATVQVVHVADDLEALVSAIREASRQHQAIITTGGASVGDHDLVHQAVQRAGGTVHFHGVAQKPGKPMLFATVNGRPFFGLPGNPRAVMVLHYEYVLPFIRAMRGAAVPYLPMEQLPTSAAITVKGERAEFRAARLRNGRVELLADEGSHMLRSLAEADALAYLPAERRAWRVGEPVEVHLLPTCR